MRKNMIKWKPFYSIPGLKNFIQDIEKETNKKHPPLIMEDLAEIFDHTIKKAIETNEKINIKYFKHGMLMNEIGLISKINTNEKYILVNNTKIYFKNIINIKI